MPEDISTEAIRCIADTCCFPGTQTDARTGELTYTPSEQRFVEATITRYLFLDALADEGFREP